MEVLEKLRIEIRNEDFTILEKRYSNHNRRVTPVTVPAGAKRNLQKDYRPLN